MQLVLDMLAGCTILACAQSHAQLTHLIRCRRSHCWRCWLIGNIACPRIHTPPAHNPPQLRLVLEMLAGDLGSEEAQRLASKIVRVVVAGGCIGGSPLHLPVRPGCCSAVGRRAAACTLLLSCVRSRAHWQTQVASRTSRAWRSCAQPSSGVPTTAIE